MFNSNATNEPCKICLIPFPFHVLQGLHKSQIYFIQDFFFTNKIDYYWEFEQQVSNVQETHSLYF